MHVSYLTCNGDIIEYDYETGSLSLDDLSNVANMYIEKTKEIPDKVFMGWISYSGLFGHLFDRNQNMLPLAKEKLYVTMALGSAGIVQFIPVVIPGPSFVLVGQQKDYNRYLAGDLLEKELLI